MWKKCACSENFAHAETFPPRHAGAIPDVQGLLLPTTTTGDEWMRIAQVAPLTEAVPPKLYGGTERVVHWLTEELVALGNDVTLFASCLLYTSDAADDLTRV